MSDFHSPQDYYDAMMAKSQTMNEQRSGISEQTKEYLRQQLLEVTRQVEAEQREAKRLAALEKRRAMKVKPSEQKENT